MLAQSSSCASGGASVGSERFSRRYRSTIQSPGPSTPPWARPFPYHRGFLAVDLDPGNGRLTERERAELRRVSRRAMLLAEDGLAHLLQRRNGPDDFSYLLVARSRPLPGSLTATPGEKVAS